MRSMGECGTWHWRRVGDRDRQSDGAGVDILNIYAVLAALCMALFVAGAVQQPDGNERAREQIDARRNITGGGR